MHSTHGAAEGHNALVEAIGLTGNMVDGGNQFIADVVDPLLVVFNTPAVVGTQSSPGFVVDRVTGKDHNLTGFNPGCPGLVHIETFKIPEAACLAGDEHDRAACVAVDLEFHLPVQMAAPMLFVANFHFITPLVFYSYNPKHSMKMGTCFSQEASE